MKVYSKLTAGLATCGLLVLGAAWARPQTQTAHRLTANVNFADKASQGNLAEVKLGQLALQKSTNNDVKQFANRMVQDHTKAQDALKNIAAKENLTLPTTVSAKDQAIYDRLSTLSGAAFDRAYMKQMVSDHRTDLALFRHEADHGTDPQIKAWAQQFAPVIAEHLKMAEETEPKVK